MENVYVVYNFKNNKFQTLGIFTTETKVKKYLEELDKINFDCDICVIKSEINSGFIIGKI